MSATNPIFGRRLSQPVDVGVINVEVEDKVDKLSLRLAVGVYRSWFRVDGDCVDGASIHGGESVEGDFCCCCRCCHLEKPKTRSKQRGRVDV